MENRTWLYNAFFKAQDRFLAYEVESGFEPEVIYDYIHCARLLASHHYQGAKEQNFLLCELFLRQIYFHFLDPFKTLHVAAFSAASALIPSISS